MQSQEPTQALTVSETNPPTTLSAEEILADEKRRQKLERELASMGLNPTEIRRLLEADANSTDPTTKSAGKSSLPASVPKKSATDREAELTRFALTLQADTLKNTLATATPLREVSLNLPEFRESTQDEKRQADALLREANILRKREKYPEAEQKCREALTLVPRDAAALEFLGDLLQGIARTEEAAAAYLRAKQADPKRTVAERKYGDLITRQTDWSGFDLEAVQKNSVWANLLSLLMPGAGHFYLGDVTKGTFFLICDLVLVILVFWSPLGLGGAHKGSGVNNSLMVLLVIMGIIYIAAVADTNIMTKREKRRPTTRSGWDV